MVPSDSWVDTPWPEIERQAARIKSDPQQIPLFVYDGEPGLDDFLAGTVEGHQRCTWHAPRGLYHAMWEDDYDQLDPEAIDAVRDVYRKCPGKHEIQSGLYFGACEDGAGFVLPSFS